MRVLPFLTLPILFISYQLNSQSYNENSTLADSVNFLLEEAEDCYYTDNFQRTVSILDEVLRIIGNRDTLEKLEFLHYKTDMLFNIEPVDDEEIIKIINEAFGLIAESKESDKQREEEIQDDHVLTAQSFKNKFYYYLGLYHFRKNDYPEAKKYFGKSIELTIKNFHIAQYEGIQANRYLAKIAVIEQRYTEALEIYTRILNDTPSYSLYDAPFLEISNEIAFLQARLRNEKLAVNAISQYVKEVLTDLENQDSYGARHIRSLKRSLLDGYYNLGQIYSQFSNTDSAMYYFNLAQELIEDNDFNELIGLHYHYLGKFYLEQGERGKALNFFEESNDVLLSKDTLKKLIFSNFIEIAAINVFKKNYPQANRVLGLAESYSSWPLNDFEFVTLHDLYSEVFKGVGDFEKAFFSLRKSNQRKDSLLSVRNTFSIDRELGLVAEREKLSLERNKELSQLKAETSGLRQEKQKAEHATSFFQKLVIILIFVTVVVSSITVWLRKEKKETEKIVSELKERIDKDILTKQGQGKLKLAKGYYINKLDVVYFSRTGDSIRITDISNTEDPEFGVIWNTSLRKLADLLDFPLFVRVNATNIVNLYRFKRWGDEKDTIIMENGDEIKVTSTYKKRVLQAIDKVYNQK